MSFLCSAKQRKSTLMLNKNTTEIVVQSSHPQKQLLIYHQRNNVAVKRKEGVGSFHTCYIMVLEDKWKFMMLLTRKSVDWKFINNRKIKLEIKLESLWVLLILMTFKLENDKEIVSKFNYLNRFAVYSMLKSYRKITIFNKKAVSCFWNIPTKEKSLNFEMKFQKYIIFALMNFSKFWSFEISFKFLT